MDKAVSVCLELEKTPFSIILEIVPFEGQISFYRLHFNPYNAELFMFKSWKVNVLVSYFRFIWMYVCYYDQYKYFNFFSAGIVFMRQNMTSKASTDSWFWRIKTIPALKGLMVKFNFIYIYEPTMKIVLLFRCVSHIFLPCPCYAKHKYTLIKRNSKA